MVDIARLESIDITTIWTSTDKERLGKTDLKSRGAQTPYRFDPGLGHHIKGSIQGFWTNPKAFFNPFAGLAGLSFCVFADPFLITNSLIVVFKV